MRNAPPAVGHCKLCEVADFRDPELQDLIQQAFLRQRNALGGFRARRAYRQFPIGFEYRKYWEVAMSLRAFREFGVLRDSAEVLGVGAGHEATIYWLTEHVKRVFATDIYMSDDAWSERESGSDMLADPSRYAERPWNPQRLVVQHMDALNLLYEDASFDGVFSSGSIEHFGTFEQVRRAVEEIYRVLRPGGLASISTEFRLEGPPPGMPGTLLFNEDQLRLLFLDRLPWKFVSPLDCSISPETVAGEVKFAEAMTDIQSGRIGWSRYPHIVVRQGEYLFTSVHVALLKPSA
jgi:SAM-dependent methyltransferase